MVEKKLSAWLEGKVIDYDKANVHIMTHSLQYGSGIFEGIRVYDTVNGPAIFRLGDHMRRFLNSAKIYSMKLNYGIEELQEACIELVRANGLSSGYIRPFAFYHDTRIGVSTEGKGVSVFIAVLPFGDYFGDKHASGVACKISSWQRINSEILPVEAKASGNYLNSIIASNEARSVGFDEAILTSGNGYVAEGPGENIFLVKNGRLVTPGVSADILMGVTRDSIIKIAKGAGIEVEERAVHKEELLTADEVFFAGTAAEITHIRKVESVVLNGGAVGPITKMLAQKYGDAARGRDEKFMDWLTFV